MRHPSFDDKFHDVYGRQQGGNHHRRKTEITEEAEKTDEEMIALGYTKVIVTAEEGADLYVEASREAEVTGHLDTNTEAWVILDEEQAWGQLYNKDEEASAQFISMDDVKVDGELTEDELITLGYHKIQVTNTKGTDIYAAADDEAEVIGHIEPETEIWIKNIATEGWAQLFTNENETAQFVRVTDLEEKILTDKEMLELGYIKVYVGIDIGANIYTSLDPEEIAMEHLEAGTELWVKLIEGAERAAIYSGDEKEPVKYINLVDIIAILKPDTIEELPTRSISIKSNLEGYEIVYNGMLELFTIEMENFTPDDIIMIQWQCSKDNGQSFLDIEGANEEQYFYTVSEETGTCIWRAVITLMTEKSQETAETVESEGNRMDEQILVNE